RQSRITLREGDRLLMALSPKAVSSTQNTAGLALSGSFGDGLTQINRTEGLIVEGVLGPDSRLVGRSINECNFRQRYRLIPMALHRRGHNMMEDFTNIPLEYGDTLLMLGTHEALDFLQGNEDIVLLNKPPLPLHGKRLQMGFTLSVI